MHHTRTSGGFKQAIARALGLATRDAVTAEIEAREAPLKARIAELEATIQAAPEGAREFASIAEAAGGALRDACLEMSAAAAMIGEKAVPSNRRFRDPLVVYDINFARAEAIAAGLMDFAADARPDFQLCEIDAWIREAAAAATPEGCALRLALDGGGAAAALDRARLGATLARLIGDAGFAMASRGAREPRVIAIATRRRARCFEIRVSRGAAASAIRDRRLESPNLFAAGLAYAADVMAAHGGGVEAATNADGASVRLWLPAARIVEAPAPALAA